MDEIKMSLINNFSSILQFRSDVEEILESSSTIPIIICGPTASGKSNFACALALRNKGKIINADSMQFYRETTIISAAPKIVKNPFTISEPSYLSDRYIENQNFTNIPHYLYNIWSIFDKKSDKSAKTWQKMAIDIISNDNKTSIIVGGSGLYLSSLIFGISDMPSVPEDIVEKYRNLWHHSIHKCNQYNSNLGYNALQHILYTQLQKCDPEIAAKLHPNDQQRIIRALSFYEAHGEKLSQYQKIVPESPLKEFRLIVMLPSKDSIRKNITMRLEQMINDGVIDEVAHIIQLKKEHFILDQTNNQTIYNLCNLPKVIGIQEIHQYILGKLNMDEMKNLIITRTTQYAKRQSTWFRNQFLAKKDLYHMIKIINY